VIPEKSRAGVAGLYSENGAPLKRAGALAVFVADDDPASPLPRLWVAIRARKSSAGRQIHDWISGAWDHVHNAILTAVGWLYRPLYWYRDHYEHLEPLIVPAEVLLIFSGLFVTDQQEMTPTLWRTTPVRLPTGPARYCRCAPIICATHYG